MSSSPAGSPSVDTRFDNTLPGADLLALRQVSRIVSRGDDAESRIQDVLRHLAVSHRLVRGRVLIADAGARQIYIRYAHGLTPAEMERGRYGVGEGVTGRVFASGQAVLIADVHEDPSFLRRVEDPGEIPPGRVAFLCVPILREDQAIGVLAALCRCSEDSSPHSDIALMEIIAALIASVLCASGQSEPWVCPRSCDASASCVAEPPSARVQGGADQGRANRDLMLRMGQQRHAEGRLHLAADLYLKVVDQDARSAEAETAAAKLLEISRYHEGKGNPRLAADVLSRLARVRDDAVSAGGRCRDPLTNHGFGGWDSFDDTADSGGGIGARMR